jgi:ZIP family zinc transporter
MVNALLLTCLAGFSTLIGGLVVFFIQRFDKRYLNLAMGSAAGVMIFVSLTELLSESISLIGDQKAIIAFFLGSLIIYLIDYFIPHAYEAEKVCKKNKQKHFLKRCGLIVALGLAIHNLPEGIAVFYSSMADFKLGVIMALAIALHNIPEGFVVSMPIFYATKSKKQALTYAFLSGFAEPLGAIISFVFLRNILNGVILGYLLACTAGIMVFISFDELLPFAYQSGNNRLTLFGVFMGMGVMALSLLLI